MQPTPPSSGCLFRFPHKPCWGSLAAIRASRNDAPRSTVALGTVLYTWRNKARIIPPLLSYRYVEPRRPLTDTVGRHVSRAALRASCAFLRDCGGLLYAKDLALFPFRSFVPYGTFYRLVKAHTIVMSHPWGVTTHSFKVI
jgi:hypothetical protein